MQDLFTKHPHIVTYYCATQINVQWFLCSVFWLACLPDGIAGCGCIDLVGYFGCDIQSATRCLLGTKIAMSPTLQIATTALVCWVMPAVSGNVIGLATYVTNQALMRISFALLVAIITAFAIAIVMRLS